MDRAFSIFVVFLVSLAVSTPASARSLRKALSKFDDQRREATTAIAKKPAKAAVIVAAVAVGAATGFVAAPAIGAAASAAGLGAAGGTLSGAAASSAGLAAMGGGSVASGGLGMAGGMALVTTVGAIRGGTTAAAVMPK